MIEHDKPNSDSENPNPEELPDWIRERAARIVARVGGTEEHAIDVIRRSQKAWESASHADPNGPIKIMFEYLPPHNTGQKIH